MKFSKRLLCTLLATLVTLTSIAVVPASAAFTDLEENHNAYDAVNVLSKLGVINGYDDGSFKPNNNVTRAEFTAMLLRTRGLGSVGSTSLENPPFPDVITPDVSWAIGNIRTAREMGIINGYDDGTFKPNNNVLYEEAVKMIVCALGYGEMGTEGAKWYSKYLMTATSLGFLDGAGGIVSVPATRATIANMLHNCLEIKLAENNSITNKTILEDDLKLTKNVGYISSNSKISLSKSEANLRDDEVEITVNGVASTYKVDDASKYEDMLGAQIEFYYKDDFNSGLKHLILATIKNSTTIKIDAGLIQDASNSGLSYLKSDDAQRETNANISSGSVVVYNGKLYGDDAKNSTFSIYYDEKGMPKVGNIELIDRNGDNVFDVVFVNDYEPYFVSSVTSSDYKITDDALRKGLDPVYRQVKLDHKTHDISFFNADGSATSFSAIKKGSVIFVAKHNHSENDAKVIVCNETISGKVTATSSSKGYTINGKNYKASRLAPWKNVIKVGEIEATPELTDAPVMGDTAKFYLDMDGNIIWYDKTEAVSNIQYGYITDAKVIEKDFEKTAGVMISTNSDATGSWYVITKKTKFYDEYGVETFEDLDDFVEALDIANDGDDNDDLTQLVKFSTSKGTEIDELITATEVDEGKEIKNNELYGYGLVEDTDWLTYKKTGNKLGSLYIGGAAFIINVSDGKYKTMKVGDFRNNTEYRVKVFDVTTTGSVKAIIVLEGNTNIGKLTGSSPVVLVDFKENKGENYVLYDVNGNEYVLADDDDTNDVAATVEQGDVVRLGGSEGKYTLREGDYDDKGYVVFRLADDPAYNGLFDYRHDENNSVNYRAIWGSVYQQDSDRIIVSKTVLDGTEESPAVYEMLKSYFKNAKIYKINEDNNEIITDITDDGYEAVLESLVHYNASGDTISRPSEIFIHMSNDTTVKTLIIIER